MVSQTTLVGFSMGCQSQGHRNLMKRAPRKDPPPKKLSQRSVFGEEKFIPEKECPICKAKALGLTKPHKSHHQRCPHNRKTKGLGSNDTWAGEICVDTERVNKLLAQEMARPIAGPETCHPSNNNQEALESFMAPRNNCAQGLPKPFALSVDWDREYAARRKAEEREKKNVSTRPALFTPSTELNNTMETVKPPTVSIPKKNSKTTKDVTEPAHAPLEVFKQQILSRWADVTDDVTVPKMVHALAGYIADSCFGHTRSTQKLQSFFRGMAFCVPPIRGNTCALYDSVVNQEILVVDWEMFFPDHSLRCPRCDGTLQRTRSNFSKNKTLFPLFGMNGPPMYAILMGYKCPCCRASFQSNDGELLATLPIYMANCYPVEPKYARGNQHITKTATRHFEGLMLIYGNGDKCSRMLLDGINKDYEERTASYYSFCKEANKKGEDYPVKDGEWLVRYPPLGETIRQLYDDAASSDWTWYKISDHDRNRREIQGVKCTKVMAHDHTHEVVKNYPSRIKAVALWDSSNERGEIAAAVLVPTTKTKDVAHATEQLLRRTCFEPKAMYTDTCPHGEDFWGLLVPGAKLCLGLFHFLQRISKTLRNRHIDHGKAIRALCL